MLRINLRTLLNLKTTLNQTSKQFKNQISNSLLRQIFSQSVVPKPNPNKSSEQEYLIRIQNDPDIFGASYTKEIVDESDLKEETYLENLSPVNKRLSTKKYADEIKSLLRKRKIKEAIDFVEIRMIKEDKVKPENYIFNLLIGACGRVGYTKKAFSLYNDIKRRGLKVHPGTYTALFNACANSPWKEDGLTRAKHLHNIMIEKQYQPNSSNYNAMIKAYGRCGDLNMAFAIVDEMIQQKVNVKDDTLNFLLQACISDEEAGFRHALLVWRKFIEKSISPTVYSYNLMLRCIRDCGLGNLEATQEVIKQILPQQDRFLQISSGDEKLEKSVEIKLSDNAGEVGRPNLMARIPCMGNIISLEEITKVEDRMLLVGGANGFLQNMSENNCPPDIKTYTQLLDCIPNTLIAEKELMQNLKKSKIKTDVDFYNMLIKKRAMRSDYTAAREVLILLQKQYMQPDLITYGVLALACKNKEEAEELIEQMKDANFRLNAEILGAMLQQACYHNNFSYVLYIMDLCCTERVVVNEVFIKHLDRFKAKCRHISSQQSPQFQKRFQIFRMRLKEWKEQISLIEQEHPWKQFRVTSETDVRHYKDKEEASQFKPIHKSLFLKKTNLKHVNKFGKNTSKQTNQNSLKKR